MAALQKLSLPSSGSCYGSCRFLIIPTNPSTVLYHRNTTAVSLSRRIFLPSVSGIWDAITGGNNNARDSVAAVRRGMQLFRQGDVATSVAEFDKAIELDPRQKAYLWQRGLSLYYLDRFEDGAEQFRIDVAQNPNDTEESIWCFLCEAQLYGVEEARRRFLEVKKTTSTLCSSKLNGKCCACESFFLLIDRAISVMYLFSRSVSIQLEHKKVIGAVGRDSRPVMRGAYNMFKDGGDPDKFASAFDNGNPSEYFYAYLYAGLYYESEKNADEAKRCLIKASQSLYGEKSDDYMASLAKVHCRYRGWTIA